MEIKVNEIGQSTIIFRDNMDVAMFILELKQLIADKGGDLTLGSLHLIRTNND